MGWSGAPGRAERTSEKRAELASKATKQLWDSAWDALIPAGADGSSISNPELLRLVKESIDETYFDDDGLRQLPKVEDLPGGKSFFERMNETFWAYGPVVVAPLGPLRTVSISDPGMVKCLDRTGAPLLRENACTRMAQVYPFSEGAVRQGVPFGGWSGYLWQGADYSIGF